MPDHLSRDTYLPLLNDLFHARQENGEDFEIELIGISELQTRPQQEQFSLLFRTIGGAMPGQDLYEVEHPKTGKFELFLVPVSGSEKALELEAVFNRLIEDR